MSSDERVIKKYLDRYAESDAARVAESPQLDNFSFKSALVVPVFSETPSFLQEFLREQSPDSGRVVILVVNAPPDARPDQLALNAAFLRQLFEHPQAIRLRADAGHHKASGLFSDKSRDGLSAEGAEAEASSCLVPAQGSLPCSLLVVDATRAPLSLKKKEGVGRARKMGFDLSLALFYRGKLKSPLVGSADADVVLPRQYFETLESLGTSTQLSAVLFPYQHLPSGDATVDQCMRQVEATFRYYTLGLAHAGSPYAYHSLGSALAVFLPSYAKVRGVPNRQAGEDFYLLSKLAQLLPIARIAEPQISITTRLSDRVPFGTGPALRRALRDVQVGQRSELLSYDPRVFDALRNTLELLVRSVRHGKWEPAEEDPFVVAEAEAIFVSLEPLLASCPSADHRERRLFEKVDALATLQLIHRFSEKYFPEVSLSEALLRAGLVPEHASQSPWESSAWLEILRSAEAQLPIELGPQLKSSRCLGKIFQRQMSQSRTQ